MGRDCKIPLSISYLRIIGLFLFGIFVFNIAYPFNNFSFATALFITLFIINIFYIILNYYRSIDYIGLMLNPIIFISMVLYLTLNFSSSGTEVEKNLYIHIIFSLASYGFLVLAGMQAFILKYQINSVKNIHNTSILNSFPSIEEMGSIMHKLILVGFILLTLSLLSGLPYISSSIDLDIEQKILFSIIAWLTFLYLIIKKSYYGIKDIASANMTIGGLIFLLLAYLGTKLLIN
tara:strand:+ start:276 stop:977 length:702 start_codon:yes stop_codon:yes gene_type:complete